MTPPRLTLDPARLARMRERLGRDARDLRPVAYRLDADGSGVAVNLPGPAYLAALLRLDGFDAYADAASLLARPSGSTEEPRSLPVLDLADGLRDTLAALPERPDAGEHYRDLRLAASVPSARFSAYLGDVVRAYRRSLSKPPAAPRPKARRTGPTKTHAETCRDSRARRISAEEDSAEAWLRSWLDPEDPPALGRALLADLHSQAVEVLEEWQDGDETLDDGREITVPGPRVFARVLDRYLGPRTRTKNGSTYTITEEHMSPSLFTRDEILVEVARQEREALLARYGATETLRDVRDVEDQAGTVVSLDAYRARRAS